ncbi:S-methyl-5-thioribose kinase [Inquilinus limosus]|uniref:S-methyl-5-thioribose kinase n=1 Tax=Inquilinus limosus TaxID=171674 RepID=A0A211ZBV1_9PROT|nr:S-methyl-5-thioribose kinase [Inquilinus limosus]OWJ62752.1 S-methyl-5-thioribose kinase [Inquilinus limosus]
MGEAQESRLTGGPDYRPLDEASIRPTLAGLPAIRDALGGDPAGWQVTEVGDGNLNLVFIVRGAASGLVVKQALPYVRLVGDSWPLPLDRAWYEWHALSEQASHVPHLLPKLFHFDPAMALIVMEWLTPHIILRKGMIAGTRYPLLAGHMAEFLAQTLFKTSDLHTPAAEKKAKMAPFCGNISLCKITEDLVFTDPYRIAKLNRWTTPQLDGIAAEFRADAAAKVAVQELKWAFLTRAEALVHGDLHTGSIMVTESDSRAIDPEFAFYGPMGFDVGALLANFFLAYFAQAGHATATDDRTDYRSWLLVQAEAIWTGFQKRFLELWRAEGTGDAFTRELFADGDGALALDAHRKATMARLFRDTVGFAGAKMVRRILGLAHVADLETIADPDVRAACETKALRLARAFLVERDRFTGPADLRHAAETVFREG